MTRSNNALKKISEISDSNHQFRELCLYYSALLQTEGVRARPFQSPDLAVFSVLSAERKQATVEHIRSILNVFEETLAEGTRLRDNRRLTWRAVQMLGWVPQSDIFDKIGDSDVINIFSNQSTLVFQTLNFFNYVSLTLEELYSNPWSQCSRREAWAVDEIVTHGVAIFTGQNAGTYDPRLREHYCEEIGTEEQLKFYIKIRYFSPLRCGGQVAGVIAVNSCRKWDGIRCESALI